jgi:hypothetical protein
VPETAQSGRPATDLQKAAMLRRIPFVGIELFFLGIDDFGQVS